MSENTEAAPAARGDAVRRMQDLKDLLDRGLITQDEYARKRIEILNNL